MAAGSHRGAVMPLPPLAVPGARPAPQRLPVPPGVARSLAGWAARGRSGQAEKRAPACGLPARPRGERAPPGGLEGAESGVLRTPTPGAAAGVGRRWRCDTGLHPPAPAALSVTNPTFLAEMKGQVPGWY